MQKGRITRKMSISDKEKAFDSHEKNKKNFELNDMNAIHDLHCYLVAFIETKYHKYKEISKTEL